MRRIKILTRVGIGLLAFAMAVTLARGADGRPANAWSFGITPAGEPRIMVVLASVPEEPLLAALTLRHELVFDGVRYFSRLAIPQIETYLVSAESQKFCWRRLDGRVIELELGRVSKVGAQRWVIRAIGSSRYRIESNESREAHEFRSCLPTSAEVGGVRYRFQTSDGKITAISREGAESPLISIRYSDGRLKAIEASGGIKFSFVHDTDGMILCVDETSGLRALACGYSGRLLSYFESAHGREDFRWGIPRVLAYIKASPAVAPFVMSDSKFSYEPTLTGTALDVKYRSKAGRERGAWRVVHKSDTVQRYVATTNFPQPNKQTYEKRQK